MRVAGAVYGFCPLSVSTPPPERIATGIIEIGIILLPAKNIPIVPYVIPGVLS
jgi:hypothetical protein